MKTLLFILFVMIIFTNTAQAETQRVIVGNPDSRNNLQVNQFYVINRPYGNYTSQIIMTYPNNRQSSTFSNTSNNNTFNNDEDFFED